MSTETLTVAPSSFEWEQVFNDEEFRTARGALFVNGQTGNRWRLILTYANRTGADLRKLWAHIGQARGKRNRIRVPLSLLNYSRTGGGGGTPLLSAAASAGATSLSFDGGSGSVTDYLVGGDFLTIGNELKMVTQDVDTTTGAGTVNIWPELHQDRADNTALDISTPHGDFFVVEASGLGAVPHRGGWLNPTVTLILEEDVTA